MTARSNLAEPPVFVRVLLGNTHDYRHSDERRAVRRVRMALIRASLAPNTPVLRLYGADDIVVDLVKGPVFFRPMFRLPIALRLSAFFAWLLVFFALHGAANAVTLTEPPKVQMTGDSATITWRTDVESGSRLNYGKSPTAMTQRADGKVSAEHSVTITGLDIGSTYYFAVGSSRQRLAEGSFTTSTRGTPAAAPSAGTAPSSPAAAEKDKPGLFSGLLSKVGLGKTTPPAATEAKPVAQRPPPTRVTWGNLSSLQDHFERHGRDFQATSPDDYAAKAWLFREQARASNWPMKLDSDGTVRMWDGRTRSFAAYNRDGTAKTFFKPDSPTYWQRQPGRPITPAQLPFK